MKPLLSSHMAVAATIFPKSIFKYVVSALTSQRKCHHVPSLQDCTDLHSCGTPFDPFELDSRSPVQDPNRKSAFLKSRWTQWIIQFGDPRKSQSFLGNLWPSRCVRLTSDCTKPQFVQLARSCNDSKSGTRFGRILLTDTICRLGRWEMMRV